MEVESEIKLRICVFSESYLPQRGGTPTQIRAMLAGLQAWGADCIVLTRRLDSSVPRSEVIESTPVYRIGPVGGGPGKKWGMILTGLFALLRLRREYDIIYVPGFRVIGIAAIFAARLLGKKTVFRAVSCGEMSGEFFRSGIAGKPRLFQAAFAVLDGIRKRILKKADCFVAISSPIAAELREFGVDPDRVRDIPNGIDPERFRPLNEEARAELRSELGLDSSEFIAVYTGRLVRYKGLPVLLKAWPQIVAQVPQARLIFLGAGGNDIHDCEQEIETALDTHKVRTSVSVVRGVDDVSGYLQAADCFVFPTEDEAFGISLIEAMACGLPVVSTAVGGIADYLVDRDNGLIVEPGDADGIADAILDLQDDPGLSARLGEQARATVGERFAQGEIDMKYAALFQQLSGRGE